MKRSIFMQQMIRNIFNPVKYCPILQCWNRSFQRRHDKNRNYFYFYSNTTVVEWAAKPSKHGPNEIHQSKHQCNSQFDSYPTVSVYCTTCSIQLFRYKKKNGTKSQLVKCYVERIMDDCVHLLRDQYYSNSVINCSSTGTVSSSETTEQHQLHQDYYCPNCQTKIARYVRIHHMPSLKWVGGKIRMSKK